jgi:hypothetical protein
MPASLAYTAFLKAWRDYQAKPQFLCISFAHILRHADRVVNGPYQSLAQPENSQQTGVQKAEDSKQGFLTWDRGRRYHHFLGEAIHERCFRKARQSGGSRGMVDLADRRRVSSDSVDWVSIGHVRTSCMAIVVVVGPGHNLVVCPDYVVLGPSYYEDMHLAPSIGDSLVDAMGKAVEKTSG